MAYDKGTPGKITSLGKGRYEVESWREEGVCYFVDVVNDTCTCSAFRHYGKCTKHLVAARAARFQQISETAKTLPTERLEELKDKYFGQDKTIWLACENELEGRYQTEMKEELRRDRQAAQQQSRDQQLKQIFA